MANMAAMGVEYFPVSLVPGFDSRSCTVLGFGSKHRSFIPEVVLQHVLCLSMPG